MAIKIQIKTRLHNDIYRRSGGGQTHIVAEWNYGPRNLVKAYRHLMQERADNQKYYGNIGCGSTWLETTDGRTLRSGYVWEETAAEIESWLMSDQDNEKMQQYLDEHAE